MIRAPPPWCLSSLLILQKEEALPKEALCSGVTLKVPARSGPCTQRTMSSSTAVARPASGPHPAVPVAQTCHNPLFTKKKGLSPAEPQES